MAIQVDPRLRRHITTYPRQMVLQITGAGDEAAVLRALDRVRPDIRALHGTDDSVEGLDASDFNSPTFVGGAIPTPRGAMLYIDGGYTPDSILQTIPDLVIARLVGEGVTEGTIGTPEPRKLPDFPRVRNCVSLRLYPQPSPVRRRDRNIVVLGEDWIHNAVEWLNRTGHTSVLVTALSATFELPIDDLPQYLLASARRRTGIIRGLVGTLETRLRAVALYFGGPVPNMAFAGGGPGADGGDLCRDFAELVHLARRCTANLAYGYVDLEETFTYFSFMNPRSDWSLEGGDAPDNLVDFCDRYVFDAYPYQLLSPGHLARLSDTAVGQMQQLPEADGPGDGPYECFFGTCEEWLPGGPSRASWRQVGRAALQPCLAEAGTGLGLRRAALSS